ncbi:acetyltransferase (GNAT) family protein [Rhizobium sullae]|uniref:Acetyltransferase (GNAT) family protein n=1 Tax=Rhizobium sullae TaxID=50338 RepID=A0A4R3Q2J6_RHISU|nr:acetyltransferase (GNAT) family protein [Rhizobium sullae]
MIIEATTCDFEALLKGTAPRSLRVVPDGTIAPPDVLEMLSKLADEIRPWFAPSARLIVGEDEVVGLCSIVRVPQAGDIHIGYGVAPARQGRGYTSRAIGELLSWGRADPRVVHPRRRASRTSGPNAFWSATGSSASANVSTWKMAR